MMGKNDGSRQLTVRVKSAKKRSLSSKLWLERQLNDPYVAEAKRLGYRSRAAFKLEEIDKRYRILKPGMRIVDLGAAPGGWSQVAARKIGAEKGRGKLLAVDINEFEAVPGAQSMIIDFLDPEAPNRILEAMGGEADLVMSDMAAPSTGHSRTDHLKIMALCEAALELAYDVLSPKGAFLAKVLQGGAENDLLSGMKRSFETVRHVKPQASRADSAELYVLATGFRGRN
ncbi:23S rRNA (uridine2552-2'-O)-methyltransferase [Rhodoligotrophos appendicifer]|uniref:RlmE family RNA methyltransferase n=1 Tax=Rhodoligotrophos appendicifer TaxID=987056 RepID=UPI001185B85F|nr:RlmE family RNA methyltransferase [Rhodoligotrophos appendicifer]